MVTLLAESKTMASVQENVTPEEYKAHTPVFNSMADSIMADMDDKTPAEISQILGISGQLAVKAHNLAYDFPHKMTGYNSIYGFTGEAYRGLDVATFTPEALDRAEENLRIISSVYGILKPYDIIKPYRCEFNKPIALGNKTPIQVFKPKVTIEFAKYIRENKVNDVIDLLPGDADKCIDWKIIRAFTSVHKVCFQQVIGQGKLKTPIASVLKEMRGIMARTILMENITAFSQLTEYRFDEFSYSPDDSKPGLPVFVLA